MREADQVGRWNSYYVDNTVRNPYYVDYTVRNPYYVDCTVRNPYYVDSAAQDGRPQHHVLSTFRIQAAQLRMILIQAVHTAEGLMLLVVVWRAVIVIQPQRESVQLEPSSGHHSTVQDWSVY